jgi:hypothetical protein
MLINDDNFSDKTTYSFDNLLNNLKAVTQDLDNIKPFEFLIGLYDITKAFRMLSSALSLAFSDITSKVDIWRSLFKTYYKDCKSIQEVIKTEIDGKLIELNGENNKKLGHPKKTPYYEYVSGINIVFNSGARTTVRLTWFLDYMNNILRNLIETNDDFTTCIKNSYSKTLGPHHGFIVRNSAKLAMSFAPSKRSVPMKYLIGISNTL